MQLVLILHNIRSAYNVGAILRTAEGLGVKKVILSGYTPTTNRTKGVAGLPHVIEKTSRQIAKSALGAEEMVTSEWSGNIIATLSDLKKRGYLVLGLENNVDIDRICHLKDWQKPLEKIKHSKDTSCDKCVLVLGEEVDGIDDSLFPLIDWFLEIPMVGKKESFNVSVAAGMAMYEILGRN